MNRAKIEERYQRQNESIRLLHAEGKTLTQIASILGMTKDQVSGRSKRMGLTFADYKNYVAAEGWSEDRINAMQVECDERFQAVLFDAWRRGEFPGQSFRLTSPK